MSVWCEQCRATTQHSVPYSLAHQRTDSALLKLARHCYDYFAREAVGIADYCHFTNVRIAFVHYYQVRIFCLKIVVDAEDRAGFDFILCSSCIIMS